VHLVFSAFASRTVTLLGTTKAKKEKERYCLSHVRVVYYVYGKYVYILHNKQALVMIDGIFLALYHHHHHHHHNGTNQNKTIRASVFIFIVCMLPPSILI
jgi:hypothetical protein